MITELNPDDPFEAAVIQIVETNRKKRNDYTIDPEKGPWWNFENTAKQTGLTSEQVVEVNIAQKQSRLAALSQSGREPMNEGIYDTILDRAVYSIIRLAMTYEPSTV